MTRSSEIFPYRGLPFRRNRARCGMSSLEVVMATAITFPLAVAILLVAVKACQTFYRMASTMVGWPFL